MNFFRKNGRQTQINETPERQPYDSMAHREPVQAAPLKNPLPPPKPLKKPVQKPSPTKYVPKEPTGFKPALPPPSKPPKISDNDSYESYDEYSYDSNSGDEDFVVVPKKERNTKTGKTGLPPLPPKKSSPLLNTVKDIGSDLLGSFNVNKEGALIGLSERDVRSPKATEMQSNGSPPQVPPKKEVIKTRVAESFIFPEGPPPMAPPKSTGKKRAAESFIFPEGPPPMAPPKQTTKNFRKKLPPLPTKRVTGLSIDEPPPVPDKTPKLKVKKTNTESQSMLDLRGPRNYKKVSGPTKPMEEVRPSIAKSRTALPVIAESLSRNARGPQPSPFPSNIRERPTHSKIKETPSTTEFVPIFMDPETPAEPLKKKNIEMSPVMQIKSPPKQIVNPMIEENTKALVNKDVKRSSNAPSNAPALSRKTSLQSFYKDVSTPRTPVSTEDIRTLGGRGKKKPVVPPKTKEIPRLRVKKKVKKKRRRRKKPGKAGAVESTGTTLYSMEVSEFESGAPPPVPSKVKYQSVYSEDI